MTGPLRRIRHRLRSARRRYAFCTIATLDFLPWALVLFDSLRRHHPRARMLLLQVAREPHERWTPLIEGVEAIPAEALVDARQDADLRRKYSIPEYCFALKPRLLRYALDKLGERAIYLDSDIDVQGPLREAAIALEGASVVLTPHLDAPIPMDGKLPSDMTILRAGSCNAGFVGVAEGEETRRFLEWWDARAARWGFLAPEAGYQGDQKWLDMAPTLFPGVSLLRDPGSNLGCWNLHSRRIARDARGGLTVNGAPLAFVHFSGFDPDKPEVLSKYQNRFEPATQPDLMALARDFGARIVAARARADGLQWKPLPELPAAPSRQATLSEVALPEGAYQARIAASWPGGILSAGEEVRFAVTITNASGERWPVARSAVGGAGILVTWHLRDGEGRMLALNNRRYPLPHDLEPGESIEMAVGVRLPHTPGRYRVEFDLVHESIAWFADHGSPTTTVEVPVDTFDGDLR